MAVAEPLPPAPDELPPEAQAWVDAPEGAEAPAMPAPDPRDLARYAAARARVEAQIAEVEAQFQRHVDQAKLWRDARVKVLRGQAGRIDLFLLALYEQARAFNPAAKTLAAPFGVTVSQRATPERYVREATGADADRRLVEYLDEAGLTDFVRIERKPAWGEFAKSLQHTPEGVVVDPNGAPLPSSLGIVFQPATAGVPQVQCKAGA